MNRWSRALGWILCLVWTVWCPLALGQETPPTNEPKHVRAVRVESAPVIDGRLDEPEWQRADVITDFHQIRPGNGATPSERTEVYLLYTADAMYIGARMYDSEPHLIATPTIRHNQGLGADDRLVVILDPFNTRRVGYRFETNLNGVRHDALYTSISSFTLDWTVIWDVATSVEENAWVAEIEIPFKTLPFDNNIENWGFNFGRGIRRRGEEMAWVSYNRTYNPSISGVATGLTGLEKGVGLDLVPSLSFNRQRRFNPFRREILWQPSLDAFYRLTPSLNAALTVNTDFSAVEVDNRQVNLTRFNLFFPERRDFFLNDADLFQFGSISSIDTGGTAVNRASRENARPFFSRRIGLDANGAPVDLEVGGRISGRVGRWNIGTLALRQGEAGALAAQDLLVTRVSANVLAESALGFILTDGNPRTGEDNQVRGVDFRYLNTRLGNGRTLETDLWVQQSDTPGRDGDDLSYGVGVRSPNNTGWRGGVAMKEVQRNFNPAMGYINRLNVRDFTADMGFTHFFRGGPLQTFFAGVDAQRINDLDDGLQSESIVFRLAEFESSQRDRLSFRYLRNQEVVLAPFTLYRDPWRTVAVQPGQYAFDELALGVNTAAQRRFVGSVNVSSGDFYDGQRINMGGSVRWNASNKLIMSLDYDWNAIELPQGDFVSRLLAVNTQYAFTPNLYWVTLAQYDNLSEQLGVNTRIQWIPEAGQEGFIVLNYNLEDRDKDNTFRAEGSDISVKFKYTIRF